METSAFVQCRSCRTQVEFGVPVCPTCGRDPERFGLPDSAMPPSDVQGPIAMPDRIGDHMFFPGDVFCAYCGTRIDVAHARRCGRA